MKRFRTELRPSIPAALLAACSLLALLTPGASRADDRAETWEVRGLMTDACQCHVFCPCELAQKPTYGHCDDTAILHIDQGHFGPVSLDGRRIVVVSQSPAGERLVDTVGRLNFARMYVPEDVTDAEARALAELARRVFGAWVSGKVARISPDETIQRVPMQATIEPRHHAVRIPGILDLDVRALTGGDGKNPVALENGPAAGPGMGPILIASSSAYRYTDHGLDWKYDGRSASMRTIDLAGRLDQAVAEPPATGGPPAPTGHVHH